MKGTVMTDPEGGRGSDEEAKQEKEKGSCRGALRFIRGSIKY